jgi:arylsulfatase
VQPDRASLLTGHYPHQAGMGWLDGLSDPNKPGYLGRLADTSATTAEVLRDAGYFTAMAGKWHMGQQNGTGPWQRGFARSLNLQAGGVHFADQAGKRGSAKLFLDGQAKELDDPTFGDRWYGSHLWADWSLRFVDEARQANKPFFVYLAHCAPHFPLMAPQATIDKYRGKYSAGWDALRAARHARQIEMKLVDPAWPLAPRPADTPAWADVPTADRERFDHMMAIYAAMIEEMDKSVGTVVQGLRERGALDDTLILFLSDNGGNAEAGPNGKYNGTPPGGPASDVFLGQNWATLNNTPFRKFKHYVHEGGIATPLIAHWPAGIGAGRRGRLEHQPGHVVDVMATLVDVTGAAYPAERDGHKVHPMAGVSLRPAFAGQPLNRQDPIVFEHEGNRAVRDGKWKLVALNKQPWELYDLEADRTETNDLAAKHPDLVKRLGDAYDAYARRTHVEPWPVKQGTGGGKKKKKAAAG